MNSMRMIRCLGYSVSFMALSLLASGCNLGPPCGEHMWPCPTGSYCRFSEGQCGSFGPNECEVIPEVCTEEFSPVCGCNGETYSNPCMAAAGGVSIDHRGSCDEFCGGIAGFTCPDDQFCMFEDGTCGQGDQAGVCMLRPEICTLEFDPVCGCDQMTYGNECEANAAGVSVQSDGECP